MTERPACLEVKPGKGGEVTALVEAGRTVAAAETDPPPFPSLNDSRVAPVPAALTVCTSLPLSAAIVLRLS